MSTNISLTDFRGGIATNANTFPVLLRLSGSNSGQPRADQKSGEIKTSPDGRPTHKVAGTVISLNREDQPQEEKTCYVNSIEPLEAELDVLGATQLYKAEGRVWIKPFVPDGGRLAYSITVEKLVPVQNAAQPQGGSSDK